MTELILAAGAALWLGILTSLSPCPLATNIAAVSYITRRITHPALVLLSGLAYTAGRMAAYAALGWVILASIMSVPDTANFLQKYMGIAIGPLLIITGLFLTEIITLKLPAISISHEKQNNLAQAGAPGAFVLGIIFAMALCPVSAALFFGSLLPMAMNGRGGLLMPLVYGLGTGLPVMAVALAIAGGATSFNSWHGRMAAIELYTRKITGAVFILAGIYYAGVYIFKVF